MARDPALWFVMIDGQESGPMNLANLSQRFAAGDIDAGTFIWKDGMDEWLPASEVDEVASVFEAPKPARRPPPPPAAAKSGKAKSKAAPEPEADSHVFRGRDDEEEIVLELDFGADKPKKPSSGRGLPSKPAPVAQTAASVSPSQPGVAQPRGGAVKPASKPYGAAIAAEPAAPAPKKDGRPLPKAPGLADDDEEDGDWSTRTSVEALPFGERVHQEKVASSLFEATDPGAAAVPVQPGFGKTGSYALDMSNWASGEMKNKAAADKAAQEKAAAITPAKPSSGSALPAPAAKPASTRMPSTALRSSPAPAPAPKKTGLVIGIIAGIVVIGAIAVGLHLFLK